MSLRKYMHPRNKYKTIPDFKQLALLYPEFRKVAITDLTGKVRVDFKNEETLRVLTEVLLKHDFNLKVKIPPNKLVPTLPLRLNYVLWIEDLMRHSNFNDMESVTGIDIGTGAVCIYPLLLANMYKCHMIGTEVDESSVKAATDNVKNNNLEDLIKVIAVSEETILKDVVKDHDTYHFTMCNPPFFETEETAETVKQQPPRNAPTGSEKELTVQGGERMFVTRMIEESIEIGSKVKIYTTMLGKKSNLLYFLKLIRRKSIQNATWTEFCQGHTKRWGLAWTFLSKDITDLTKAPVIRKSEDYIAKLLKDHRPTEIVFSMGNKYSSVEDVIALLKKRIDELNITVKELHLHDDFDGWACQLTAEKDTWSHARRKRRLAQRQMNQSDKQETEHAEKNNDHETDISVNNKADSQINTPVQEKTSTSAEQTKNEQPLLVCNLFVESIENEEVPDEGNVKISMTFEKGDGGKYALETFRQYLINQLNIREYFQKQCCKKNKKKRKRIKKSRKHSSETSTVVHSVSENSSESS